MKGLIFMSTQATTTTTRATTEEMYTIAEKAVFIALRARHEKSGLHFLAELQNAQKQDIKCRQSIDLVNEIDISETELATLQEELAELRKNEQYICRQAESLKNTAELRTAYAMQLRTIKARADLKKDHIKRLSDHISDLYEEFNNSYSDRADLTQTALVKILELEKDPAPITSSILAEYGAENPEELSEEERTEAQARANFKAVINTVGKVISTVATPEALNSHKTKIRKATDEDVQEWLSVHGGHGDKYKEYVSRKRCRMSDCYRTLEYKDTKTMKGFYIVTHYKTVAPYQYIEDYAPTDENGENDIAYMKTYNPIVNDYADIEGIADLCDSANLSDTERVILEYYSRALRFYSTKADIIKYICNCTKLSQATVYRRIEAIKTALTPMAEDKHIIKKSRKGA